MIVVIRKRGMDLSKRKMRVLEMDFVRAPAFDNLDVGIVNPCPPFGISVNVARRFNGIHGHTRYSDFGKIQWDRMWLAGLRTEQSWNRRPGLNKLGRYCQSRRGEAGGAGCQLDCSRSFGGLDDDLGQAIEGVAAPLGRGGGVEDGDAVGFVGTGVAVADAEDRAGAAYFELHQVVRHRDQAAL